MLNNFETEGFSLIKPCKQKGWSQEKLAVESGISYNTIIKLEAGGIINPRMDTLMKLSDALGVSIDKLVGRMREK